MEFIIVSALSWLVAQLIKFAVNIAKERKKNGSLKGLNPSTVFASGGMPSSHTATVVSLTASVLFNYGIRSHLLAICVVFAVIVIFDAMNVRKVVGDMAKQFNDLAWQFYDEHNTEYKRIKVIEGHSFLEVLAGAAVGFTVSFLIEGLPKLIAICN